MAIFNLIEKGREVPNLSSKLAKNAPVGAIYDIINAIKEYGNFDKYNGILKSNTANVERLIVFRHEDLDGAGAAASIIRFLHANIETIEVKCNYIQEFDIELTDRDEVWFVDYSFTNEANQKYLEKAIKTTEHVVWIDHHASSVNLINNNPKFKDISGIVQDFKLSGALLTYLYVYILQFDKNSDIEVKIPDIIQYISDYDTFSFQKGRTKEFFLGISTVCYNLHVFNEHGELFPIWNDLFNADNMLEYIEKGAIINDYNTITDQEYIEKFGFEAKICGIKALVVNRKGNSFMFGTNYIDYDITCSYAYNGKDYSYTLFADEAKAKEKGYSCEEICKKFGGGGHLGAAGFSLDYNLFEKDSENVKRL